MWGQANNERLQLKPLTNFGWKIEDEDLLYDWDSEENMSKVRERVYTLTRGCHCKTGCSSAKCSCRKKGKACAVGCECTNCTNRDEEYEEMKF